MRYSETPKTGMRPSRLFSPILAGATLRERLISCVGALIAIGLTGAISGYFFGHGPYFPLIVAPMGASAVLLFAVPASPLAQPWSIIGGNTISAMMGIIAAYLIHDPAIAIGVGVALAIGAMSFTRSLHPPGGAAALTAVLGGPAVAKWGFLFPFVPVALNSCLLVGLGLAFHKLSKRNYPHVAPKLPENTHQTRDLPSATRVRFREEDVDAALAAMDETFDIDRADLSRLVQEVEQQAILRSNSGIICADIMSRDVIAVQETAEPEEARRLLLKHNIRILPVKDSEGRLIGTVGLRELAAGNDTIRSSISKPAVAAAADPALSLLPVLTDGRTHAVIIIDAERQIVGLISQTDLLNAVARLLPKDNPVPAAA
ncbi:HPP family protein [Rhizobium mayense]|uniref:HPP family protein n=1 Tax=Rhizobium mayense TaxID=1312184 RepID=A0ABT7K638_9HYPH|nr:HPP family protein [Rhizobium mayense]MDL2403428.1 HPP family protein [Rhizobium mayense]